MSSVNFGAIIFSSRRSNMKRRPSRILIEPSLIEPSLEVQ